MSRATAQEVRNAKAMVDDAIHQFMHALERQTADTLYFIDMPRGNIPYEDIKLIFLENFLKDLKVFTANVTSNRDHIEALVQPFVDGALSEHNEATARDEPSTPAARYPNRILAAQSQAQRMHLLLQIPSPGDSRDNFSRQTIPKPQFGYHLPRIPPTQPTQPVSHCTSTLAPESNALMSGPQHEPVVPLRRHQQPGAQNVPLHIPYGPVGVHPPPIAQTGLTIDRSRPRASSPLSRRDARQRRGTTTVPTSCQQTQMLHIPTQSISPTTAAAAALAASFGDSRDVAMLQASSNTGGVQDTDRLQKAAVTMSSSGRESPVNGKQTSRAGSERPAIYAALPRRSVPTNPSGSAAAPIDEALAREADYLRITISGAGARNVLNQFVPDVRTPPVFDLIANETFIIVPMTLPHHAAQSWVTDIRKSYGSALFKRELARHYAKFLRGKQDSLSSALTAELADKYQLIIVKASLLIKDLVDYQSKLGNTSEKKPKVDQPLEGAWVQEVRKTMGLFPNPETNRDHLPEMALDNSVSDQDASSTLAQQASLSEGEMQSKRRRVVSASPASDDDLQGPQSKKVRTATNVGVPAEAQREGTVEIAMSSAEQ